MSSKPDITSITKEEIVAYYEKLMAQQAQNQTSTILNLKKEISKERLEANEKLMAQSQQLDQKARELEIAKTDNYIENWRRSRDFLSVCRTFDGLQTFAVL